MDLVFLECGIEGADEGAVEDRGSEGEGDEEDRRDGADDGCREAPQAGE